MTEFTISTWVLWAIGIAATFAIGLNGGPRLPWFRDLQPSRIEARLVGYSGLTLAFWLWIVLNPNESANHTGIAWLIICLATLIPNTIIHLHRRDNNHEADGNNDPGSDNGAGLPRRSRDILLNAIAQQVEANRALAAQWDMLNALYALIDPEGVRRSPEEREEEGT